MQLSLDFNDPSKKPLSPSHKPLNSSSICSGDDDDSSSINLYENNALSINNRANNHSTSTYLLMQSGTVSNISAVSDCCFSSTSQIDVDLNANLNAALKEEEAKILKDSNEENEMNTNTYHEDSTFLNNQLDINGNVVRSNGGDAESLSEGSDKKKKIIVRVVTLVSAFFFIICFAMIAFTLRMSEQIDEEIRKSYIASGSNFNGVTLKEALFNPNETSPFTTTRTTKMLFVTNKINNT